MDTRRKRIAEVIVVLLVWTGLFMGLLGPAIGAVFPGFDRPALSGEDDVTHRGDLPETGRGWLMILLGVPVLLGYMLLRANLADVPADEFWNPGNDERGGVE